MRYLYGFSGVWVRGRRPTIAAMKKNLSAKVSALIGVGAVVSFLLVTTGVMAYTPFLPHGLNLPSLSIVLGGTLAATCISYPLADIRGVWTQLRVVFGRSPESAADIERDVAQLVEMARLWLQADVRRIEAAVDTLANPVLRTGVQWLVNQTPPHQTLELLHTRMDLFRARASAQVQMLRAMAGFAPAFGMLGTVMSLTSMMTPLTADPSGIGSALTMALMSTFYGLLLANLVCRPLAVRLERYSAQRLMVMNLMVQGIAMMSEKRGPAVIRETLRSFLTQDDECTPPRQSTSQTNLGRAALPWLQGLGRRHTVVGSEHGSHATVR